MYQDNRETSNEKTRCELVYPVQGWTERGREEGCVVRICRTAGALLHVHALQITYSLHEWYTKLHYSSMKVGMGLEEARSVRWTLFSLEDVSDRTSQ